MCSAVLKNSLGNMRTSETDMAALEATMRTIGEKFRPTAGSHQKRL
jgi:hypothetical protein